MSLVYAYEEMPENLNTNGYTLIDWEDLPEIARILNDNYTFYGNYQINGQNVEYLKEDNFIRAKDEDGKEKYFEIKNVVKNLNSYSITAQAIGFQLARNFIENSYTSNGNGTTIMRNLKNSLAFNQLFIWSSDITTSHQFTVKQTNPIDAIIGNNNGNENLASITGGELDMDNYAITLKSRIGTDNGYRVDFGVNLEAIEENIDGNYYNSLYLIGGTPEGDYDEDKEPITYKYLELPGVTDKNRRIGKYDNSEMLTESELKKWGQTKFDNDRVHEPKVTHAVSMVHLENTIEYKELYDTLAGLHFGDTCHVNVEKLGITVSERMVEYIWYPTIGKFKDVILGNDISFYTNVVATETNKLKRKLDTKAAMLVETVRSATSWITGNQGGHVIFRPEKSPQEVLIMDTDDVKTAKKVWRWNLGGLGYSSTGVDGEYGLAMTQDGAIVADFITAGVLRAIDIIGVNISGSTIKSKGSNGEELTIQNGMLGFDDVDGNLFASFGAGSDVLPFLAYNLYKNGKGIGSMMLTEGLYHFKHDKEIRITTPKIDLRGDVFINGQQIIPGGTGGGGWNGKYPSQVVTQAERFAWQAWIALLNLGLSKAAAAGILGNIRGEAGATMNPDTEQVEGPAYGAVQFDGSAYPLIGSPTWDGREYFKRIYNAANVGGDYREMATQMKVVNWALYNGQWIGKINPTTVSGFKSLTSPETAANVFEENFERPATAHAERQGYAREWYDKFKDLKQPGGVDGYAMPVLEKTPVTSWFGQRWGTQHNGIDFGGTLGDPIFASRDGEVVLSLPTAQSGGFGEYIVIKHNDGYMTGYGHLTKRMKQVGEKVTQGQQIGTLGNTGDSTGPHLHFSVQKELWSGYVDPAPFLGLTAK